MTTLLPARTRPLEPTTAAPALHRAFVGARELGFLAVVYVGYAVTRVLADDSFAPARERAARLVAIEQPLGLGFEQPLNDWFAGHHLVGAAGAFHYASAHYLVTAAVLVWLFVRRPSTYVVARRTLVVATVVALGVYLLAPTAPPRLVGGFTDVLAQHSGAGWWGAEASAPKGLGELTNQLAAFPSMHAGWALWVALAVAASTRHWLPRLVAWSHAVVTALVVIGTGNHWTLDVVAGWALIAFVWRVAETATLDEQRLDPVISGALRR
ncbi:phosphatase PAP2 family protein [Nocardioides piscis]|uniref:Inositol phosphorylceramide synthase n=1 Tax=Nocardioides piscis TaxID=2714938 RepID=A0A6G7YCM8_9ACTN|nr:phosphatase PAP2 family protein [Nocardioides piscis]QIK74367.1 inositol phosphorylceramide synthase [Nocardioides piscis]